MRERRGGTTFDSRRLRAKGWERLLQDQGTISGTVAFWTADEDVSSGCNELRIEAVGEISHNSYCAVHPPSMRIVSPVTRDAALEARNTTAPATSIGSPMRCNAAMRSITSARNSGFARPPPRSKYGPAVTRENCQRRQFARASRRFSGRRAPAADWKNSLTKGTIC